MHDGDRYRVVFSRGMLVTLLGRAPCNEVLGITWLTFLPDATILAGEGLTFDKARRIAERMGRHAEGMRIRVEDRTMEDADWY
jgi:hypothetical protein